VNGNLPPSGTRSEDVEWGGLLSDPEEAYPEKIKIVVSPTDYGKEEVEQGKTFYISNDIKGEERAEYARILKVYSDVFAWTPTDLEGIPTELGEYSIDLQEGAVSVRQRQYRLNPRYSLMVKEEIDRLLKARFIYPVNNSEWVSPIVVLPKKVGADGKVKIRVCQDFWKLNSATKKDYFSLAFTDIILNQGYHKGRFWRKITVRTSFSFGRPRVSAFTPRTRFYTRTGFYRPRMRKIKNKKIKNFNFLIFFGSCCRLEKREFFFNFQF
jgi:hypothetical protein